MIPYDIDSSLHPGEPLLETLDDGFSPPDLDDGALATLPHRVPPAVEPGWDEPSEF
jgi:hypothetical protein